MLTACLNLVQLHDVCDLHDQPKVGCCFFLRLPTFCNKFNKTKKTKKTGSRFCGAVSLLALYDHNSFYLITVYRVVQK